MSQMTFEEIKKRNLFSDLRPHIVKAFWVFHLKNPHVWELFVRFSHQAFDSGRKCYGSKAIFERIRWYTTIETQGEDFKICNNYSSCYSRLLIMQYPKFEGFFQIKAHRDQQ